MQLDLKMKPLIKTKKINAIELFAGCGGLALGMKRAGVHCVLLNDNDKWACQTLKQNRPDWNIIHSDVRDLDFIKHYKKVDVISGGFPCQSFSYAGKKGGLNDVRGTLFYEFARAVKEVQPKICIAENVKGLLSHDNGKTLETMKSVLSEIGYTVLEPKLMKAVFYKVQIGRAHV